MNRAAALLLLLLCAGRAPAQASSNAASGLGPAFWTGLAGAAGGFTLGVAGPNFAAYTGNERTLRETRSGLTYGLLGGLVSAGLAAAREPRTEAQAAHPFFDRTNLALFTGIAAVQTLDYTSTRYFRDRGFPEWLLTNGEVDKTYVLAPTEIAAAAAGVGLSFLLHRGGHHSLERLAAAGYVVFGAVSAAANYRYPKTGHDLFGQ